MVMIVTYSVRRNHRLRIDWRTDFFKGVFRLSPSSALCCVSSLSLLLNIFISFSSHHLLASDDSIWICSFEVCLELQDKQVWVDYIRSVWGTNWLWLTEMTFVCFHNKRLPFKILKKYPSSWLFRMIFSVCVKKLKKQPSNRQYSWEIQRRPGKIFLALNGVN